MSTSVHPTPTAPTIHGATNHTVSVEYMTVAELQAAGQNAINPNRAVVERYNGQIVDVVAVEGDAFLDIYATVDEIAAAYADFHGAVLVAPREENRV